MSSLVIEYKELAAISAHASDLAKKAGEYADSLTRKITKKFDSVAGGVNDTLASAKYYVEAKIEELEEKETAYDEMSDQIDNFIENAKRIDKSVADKISENYTQFIDSNQHLKIAEWKADIINWLVDRRNKSFISELDFSRWMRLGNALSGAVDNIRYWYKCEGGKETLALVWAVGGAAAATLLFVASLAMEAVTFVTVCAVIAAAITMINSVVNVVTSIWSLRKAKTGDPAWAKIYGDMDTFQDYLRLKKFNSRFSNKLSYIGADVIDAVKLFCDVVNIIHAVSEIRSKLRFIQNYFDINTGLLSYFKELKYNKDGIPIVADNGTAKTRFTFRSIGRGIKAFVLNSPIDCRSEMGIRTLLRQNFKIDLRDFWKSLSIKNIKDTICFDNKLCAILFGKGNSLAQFAKSSWKIKDTAKTLESVLNFGQNIEKIANGSFDIKKSIMKQVYNINDVFTIGYKLGVTKAIVDKRGLENSEDGKEWKIPEDGLGQKIAEFITKSYPFIKTYGIVN